MNKYLIAYGIESGKRALNNPTRLISAENKEQALTKFRELGRTEKVQLIKKVDY